MYDKIMKEKEMLIALNKSLEELKDFLIGKACENDSEKQPDTCFQDTITNNLREVDEALRLTNIIKEAILGGNK